MKPQRVASYGALQAGEAGDAMRQPEAIEIPKQASVHAETLWTSQDVADFLQVSLRWVEKQRAAGVLPCVPLPGRRLVRYDPARIRAWALKRATAGQDGLL